jgi:hypothetical protein
MRMPIDTPHVCSTRRPLATIKTHLTVKIPTHATHNPFRLCFLARFSFSTRTFFRGALGLAAGTGTTGMIHARPGATKSLSSDALIRTVPEDDIATHSGSKPGLSWDVVVIVRLETSPKNQKFPSQVDLITRKVCCCFCILEVFELIYA